MADPLELFVMHPGHLSHSLRGRDTAIEEPSPSPRNESSRGRCQGHHGKDRYIRYSLQTFRASPRRIAGHGLHFILSGLPGHECCRVKSIEPNQFYGSRLGSDESRLWQRCPRKQQGSDRDRHQLGAGTAHYQRCLDIGQTFFRGRPWTSDHDHGRTEHSDQRPVHAEYKRNLQFESLDHE